MPDWFWFVLLLLCVSLLVIGLIRWLLAEADRGLIAWADEEPHPDVIRIAAFPEGLDA